MRRVRWCCVLLGTLAGAAPLHVAPRHLAQPAFPAQYRQLVRYAVIDRPDGVVRYVYAPRGALAAVRAGQRLPIGTTLVIEAFAARRDAAGRLLRDRDGHLLAGARLAPLDVMVKRADQAPQADFSFQNWAMARFDAASGTPLAANLADCWICHQSVNAREFVFTRRALLRAALSGKAQRRDCGRPDRQLCAGDFAQITGHRP